MVEFRSYEEYRAWIENRFYETQTQRIARCGDSDLWRGQCTFKRISTYPCNEHVHIPGSAALKYICEKCGEPLGHKTQWGAMTLAFPVVIEHLAPDAIVLYHPECAPKNIFAFEINRIALAEIKAREAAKLFAESQEQMELF